MTSRRGSRRGPAATPGCCASDSVKGDGADVAQLELVGSEYDPNAEVEKPEGGAEKTSSKRTLGQRLKATADRIRAKKDETEKPPKAPKPSRGAARKVTTPRKAGGS